MDKSKAQLWRENLEKKTKKLNKIRLRELLADRIIEMREEGKGNDKMTILVGLNFADHKVEIRNRKEQDALTDLATLNGYTVE